MRTQRVNTSYNRVNKDQHFESKATALRSLKKAPSHTDYEAVDNFVNQNPIGMLKELILRFRAYRRIQARKAQALRSQQNALFATA